MTLRSDTRARSLGTTLLLWGLAALGVLFVLSLVVAAVVSIVTTVVAIVTTVATALLLAGVAYLVASWALGSDDDEQRSRSRVGRQRHRDSGYGLDASAGRHTGERRSGDESDDGSLLGRIPGLGSDDDRSNESPTDPIDRLTDQYVSGEIGEAEYERRLELHLDGPSASSRERIETGRNRSKEYER